MTDLQICSILHQLNYNSTINIYLNDGAGNLQEPTSVNNIRKDSWIWVNPTYIDLNNDGYKILGT